MRGLSRTLGRIASSTTADLTGHSSKAKRDNPHSSPPPSRPPPPYSPPCSPTSRPTHLDGDNVELGNGDSGIRHRNGEPDLSEQDKEAKVSTAPVEEENVAILKLFMDDYRRTKEYIRELEWRVAVRKALRRHLYKWYALAIIVITISALLSIKHEDIVKFTEPLTRRIRSWPGGWLVPLAALIIVSFPPLVGHEIIGILCGLVWGLGVGFAILAAGTFFGEIATWIAFKWFCTARAARFEKKNKLYSSLTQLIREKSFMFVLVLRFSAVPGHITTAVSASAGANFWSYLAAAFLTLPKQLTIAYLGTAFGSKSKKNTIISVTTTIATLIGTVIAAVYIYYQMRLVMRRQPTTIPGLPTTMQEAQVLSLDLRDSTLARRATVHAIKSAPHDKHGHHHFQDLHLHRPWLFSHGDDHHSSALARTRSLPGPLNDDQIKWLATYDPLWRAEHPTQARRARFNRDPIDMRRSSSTSGSGSASGSRSSTDKPAILIDGVAEAEVPMDDLKGSPYRPRDSAYAVWNPASSRSGLLDSTHPSQQASRAQSRAPSPSPDTYTPRGTVSLDLVRHPSHRLGGREIADEADLFALSRGAKRPEYGRYRGESRAALLGRPDWDERSEAGDSVSDMIGRSRSGTMGTTATVSDRGDGSLSASGMDRGKEREYGRPRGESGAALLGRPDL